MPEIKDFPQFCFLYVPETITKIYRHHVSMISDSIRQQVTFEIYFKPTIFILRIMKRKDLKD